MAASRPDRASSPGVRACMQANRGRDTKPELQLRSAVHALGLRYRVGIRPVKAVRRTADLVFTRARIAVFLDGCFWHGCPTHHTISRTNAEYWADKIVQNRRRDRETDEILASAGWIVLRVWEHEDPQVAAVRVQIAVGNALDQRSAQGSDSVFEREERSGRRLEPPTTGTLARAPKPWPPDRTLGAGSVPPDPLASGRGPSLPGR